MIGEPVCKSKMRIGIIVPSTNLVKLVKHLKNKGIWISHDLEKIVVYCGNFRGWKTMHHCGDHGSGYGIQGAEP